MDDREKEIEETIQKHLNFILAFYPMRQIVDVYPISVRYAGGKAVLWTWERMIEKTRQVYPVQTVDKR